MAQQDSVIRPDAQMSRPSNHAVHDAGRDDARNGRPCTPPSEPFDVEAYILGYYGFHLKI